MGEVCECGHLRSQHADRDNVLQVVPLSMTEADEDREGRTAGTVRGTGPCSVEGCGCGEFRDAE